MSEAVSNQRKRKESNQRKRKVSDQRRRNVAVILAGGVGSRMARDVPKQLLDLAGKPVIEHSIATFDAHEAIDDVVVVMLAEHIEVVRSITSGGRYPKVLEVIVGGSSRTDSTIAALNLLSSYKVADHINVLIHDAARPLVAGRIIADVVAALDHYQCVSTAIASTDTVIETRAVSQARGGPVELMGATLNRDVLRRVQTPQGFDLAVLRHAYDLAALDSSFTATDDCGVVARYLPDVDIAVVAGDEQNLKITQRLDLLIAEQILRTTS